MARIFVNGFETGNFDGWTQTGSQIQVESDGGSGYQCYGWWGSDVGGSYLLKNLPDMSAVYMGFKWHGNNGNTTTLAQFRSSANVSMATLKIVNGILQLRRGDHNGTVIATGTYGFPYYVFRHIQIKYVPDDTSGIFQVKVDGVLDIDYSGDTTNSGTSVGKFVQYFTYSRLDDVVVDDANWPGITKIVALVPTGAGNSTMWDPSAGNNWDCVNERPASDTDYVYTNTTDDVDTYALGDLPAEAYAIHSVSVVARAKFEGTGPQDLACVVRTNGTDYPSSAETLASSYAQVQKIWETNPDTTSPWSVSEVNALEAGIKKV